MSNSPLPLSITYKQAQRLTHYIQIFRRFAWENIEPTAERNAELRALQALHGRIMSKMDQQNESIILPIMPDERLAMKMMIRNLLSQYEGSSATKEYTLAITDLMRLKSFLDDDIVSS